jgi:hypothetical protein
MSVGVMKDYKLKLRNLHASFVGRGTWNTMLRLSFFDQKKSFNRLKNKIFFSGGCFNRLKNKKNLFFVFQKGLE